MINRTDQLLKSIKNIYTGLHPNVGGATITRQEILDICETAINEFGTEDDDFGANEQDLYAVIDGIKARL